MYETIIDDNANNVKLVIGRLFTLLGFKSKLLGTQYLQEAVLYQYGNVNDVRVGRTSSAYNAIACAHNSTCTRVERAIRNSIVNCHTQGALKSFNILTHAPIIDAKFAPSNGEFMCSVVNWLRLETESGRIK